MKLFWLLYVGFRPIYCILSHSEKKMCFVFLATDLNMRVWTTTSS